MVGLLTISLTGGALVTSLGIYKRLTNIVEAPQQGSTWRDTLQKRLNILWGNRAKSTVQIKQIDPIVSTDIQLETHPALHFGLRTSTLSLGLASTGLLFFPPLRYASVPVLLYMGAPSAQDAYEILAEEGRLGKAFAETVALAVCLASGFYLAGSLGFTLYYWGQTVHQKEQWYNHTKKRRHSLPRTAQLLCADGDTTVAVSDLQIGDVIVIHSGEIAPSNGLITEGMAWLKSPVLMSTASETFKQTGDMVAATDIVLVGRICVQVRPAT